MAEGVICSELLVRAQEEHLLDIKQGLALAVEEYGSVRVPNIQQTEQNVYMILLTVSAEEAKVIPVKRTLERYVRFYRDLMIHRIYYSRQVNPPPIHRAGRPSNIIPDAIIEQLNYFNRK